MILSDISPDSITEATGDYEAVGAIAAPHNDDDQPDTDLLWTATCCAIFTIVFLAGLTEYFR